jgi:hypothetical protein
VKWTLCAVISIVLGRSLLAQSAAPIPLGTAVARITCADPSQSYALYLPSSYSAARKWPILFVFDPAARGERAVEVIKAAAEKFGYIIAASNNSRNGPFGGSTAAANAMWNDTQQRFSVDERRRYVGGMSGGARVATGIALSCNGCVGVIANAAGFPVDAVPDRNPKFVYFAAVGNTDFNYPEFVELRRTLKETNAHYRIREFEGGHGWAPGNVWMEALDWIDLQAMSTGILPRDPARIKAALDADFERAHSQELRKDWLGALHEYESIVRDFDGLAEVAPAKARLIGLAKDKALKAAEKQELFEIASQSRMTAAPSAMLQAMASADLTPSDRMELRGDFIDLKNKAAKSSNDSSTALVVKRALGSLIVQAFESGQRSLEQKDYNRALIYFDLIAAGSEEPGWAHYHRARVFAMAGEKKNMLAELKVCLEGDIHDSDALNPPEFDPYRNAPEFQKLANQWKEKAHP